MTTMGSFQRGGAANEQLPDPRQEKITWEECFMGMAILGAKRSKNPREQVGCCIVNDRRQIFGIGYNNFPRMDGIDEKSKKSRIAEIHEEIDAKVESEKKQTSEKQQEVQQNLAAKLMEKKQLVGEQLLEVQRSLAGEQNEKRVEELKRKVKCIEKELTEQELLAKDLRETEKRILRKYQCPATINAIANGNSPDLRGCTLYITEFPCNKSAQAIIQAGIKNVVYLSDTRKADHFTIGAQKMFDETGVRYSRFVLQKSRSEVYQSPTDFVLKLVPDKKAEADWNCKYPNPPVNANRPVGPRYRKEHLERDELNMAIAVLASRRSQDPKTQVGCCIVSDEGDPRRGRIAGVGYNGMPLGFFDRPEVWQNPKNDPLNSKHMYVCHAELNAVFYRTAESLQGCSAYVTLFPCNACAQVLIQSGVRKVVYLSDEKRDGKEDYAISRRLLEAAGVELVPFKTCHPDSEAYEGELSLRFTSAD